MHTLVTFLGRADREAMKKHGGYRRADYRFPDGTVRTQAFFGIALKEHLIAHGGVDRMLILGTSSSMWSVLIEHLATGDEAEAQRIALLDREGNDGVDAATLQALEPLVCSKLGVEVRLRLIDRAADSTGQQRILQTVAAEVADGTVSIDVTHGFRHLAMIGLVSAQMLMRARGLQLAGLWYGALEMSDPETRHTPVLRLDGLVAIQRWVEAIAAFDASGDYALFAPLFQAEGAPASTARLLETAADHEHQLNVSGARQSLNTFLQQLPSPWPGAAGLFETRLRRRLDWIRQSRLDEQQYALAERALDRRDSLRAALLLREGLITAYCLQNRLIAERYEDREIATRELEQDLDEGLWTREVRDAIRDLRQIRNALAHGARPNNPRIQQLLSSRKTLLEALRRILQQLRVQQIR
jgi:CRISPR-associated Csx2 family protein